MRRNRKTTSLALVGAILLFGGLWASPAVAQDRFETVYTGPNADVPYGVRDNATGIIWGRNIASGIIHFDPNNVEHWQDAENAKLAEPGGISLADGRTDWRMPMIVEALEALDEHPDYPGQRLVEKLDFSLEAGDQLAENLVDPDDPESSTWGQGYYFTACVSRSGQVICRYVFRFSDGDHFLQWGGGSVLPIRNAGEADHSSCPHKTKGSGGSKGKGKNK